MTRQAQGMASTKQRSQRMSVRWTAKRWQFLKKSAMVLVRLLKGDFGSAGAHETLDKKALRLLRNYQTSAQSRLSWNGLFLIQKLASFLRYNQTKQLQYRLFSKPILRKLQASFELGRLGTDEPYKLVNTEYQSIQIQKKSTRAVRSPVDSAYLDAVESTSSTQHSDMMVLPNRYERIATLMLEERDKDKAERYITRATDGYRARGATAKRQPSHFNALPRSTPKRRPPAESLRKSLLDKNGV